MQSVAAGSAVFFLSTGGDCSFAAEDQTQNNTEFTVYSKKADKKVKCCTVL